MPVQLNEPISFLQRVVEYMEYAHLLEMADSCTDPVERMQVSWSLLPGRVEWQTKRNVSLRLLVAFRLRMHLYVCSAGRQL